VAKCREYASGVVVSLVRSLEVAVVCRELGDSWIDEAVVVVGGIDLLATLGRSRWQTWIGRDPQITVGPDSALVADAQPRDAMVARCDCGEEGCAALIARIQKVGAHVVWDHFRSGSDSRVETRSIDSPAMVFDAVQYDASIRAANGIQGLWLPTARRTAVLIQRAVASLDLQT
jgi:hypothetical protein